MSQKHWRVTCGALGLHHLWIYLLIKEQCGTLNRNHLSTGSENFKTKTCWRTASLPLLKRQPGYFSYSSMVYVCFLWEILLDWNMRGSTWIIFNLISWLNTAPQNGFIREIIFIFTEIYWIHLGLLSQELLSVRWLSVFLLLSMLTLMIPGLKNTVVVNDGFMKIGNPTLQSNIRKQGTEYWIRCLTGWISQSKCDEKCRRHFCQ